MNPDKSFLGGELKVLIIAVAIAFVVMTVLFIAPVFVAGNQRFEALAEMTIVTKVLLPLQITLALFMLGTVVNTLIHVVRVLKKA